jgi:hypothetical protein
VFAIATLNDLLAMLAGQPERTKEHTALVAYRRQYGAGHSI